jgi:hypothetical protein
MSIVYISFTVIERKLFVLSVNVDHATRINGMHS